MKPACRRHPRAAASEFNRSAQLLQLHVLRLHSRMHYKRVTTRVDLKHHSRNFPQLNVRVRQLSLSPTNIIANSLPSNPFEHHQIETSRTPITTAPECLKIRVLHLHPLHPLCRHLNSIPHLTTALRPHTVRGMAVRQTPTSTPHCAISLSLHLLPLAALPRLSPPITAGMETPSHASFALIDGPLHRIPVRTPARGPNRISTRILLVFVAQTHPLMMRNYD